MKDAAEFEFDDLQGVLRFGHGKLTESCFMLLDIVDAQAAREWLHKAPVSSAAFTKPAPDRALQIAFSVQGLRALGLKETILENFSDEFITGMTGDENRSRRLGDIGANAPHLWSWGGDARHVAHILLLLYAVKGGIKAWRKSVESECFSRAFKLLSVLPTLANSSLEPFGFTDGISQPVIDWHNRQGTGLHERDRYSNLLAVGEMVLGYANEYGEYTNRPLVDPHQDSGAEGLPDAEEQPMLKDLGRNGAYLVIRQLHQDVPGFWQFVDKATDTPLKREQLAAAMVGRERDGTPMEPPDDEHIAGIETGDRNNHFTYKADPAGHLCPLGAHIRRANPRSGDYPPGVNGFFSRLVRLFGFGLKRPDEDLVASTRFHRLLRRGRSYGSPLTPEEALDAEAPAAERGLQFICLVANISRQFEFVQNAWMMNSKFNGVNDESDPLLGNREPLLSGGGTDMFSRPDPDGPVQKTCRLPQFTSVRGGGYFFMPGLRALNYIAALPGNRDDEPS